MENKTVNRIQVYAVCWEIVLWMIVAFLFITADFLIYWSVNLVIYKNIKMMPY